MKVMLVEDHPGMRFAVRSLLRHAGGMEVVGEAASAEEAMKLVVDGKPDVVVLDIQIKGEQNGIILCRDIMSLPDPPKVLIYTAFSFEEALVASLAAGADGFMNKGTELEELPEAVRKVHSGDRVLLDAEKQEQAKGLIKNLAEEATLTPREQEVFDLIARNFTNHQIAAELFISIPTVKTHVGHVLAKLGLKDRKELQKRIFG